MFKRRDFIKATAAAGAGIALGGKWRFARAQGALLDPVFQPKFVNPLPNPLDPGFIFQPVSGTHYEIGAYQFAQSLGLVDPALGTPLPNAKVWGYGAAGQSPTYPGRTLVVRKGSQVTVRWTNQLPGGHFLPVDTSLHWASHTDGQQVDITSEVPLVTHVHGGHTESASDGLPEFWFTRNFAKKGPSWVKETYVYDNDQPAGTIWYHDHALGITRLNVYAGLAGFYIIRDAVGGGDDGTATNGYGLPHHPFEVPIVIQDRLFTAAGQLYYPSADPMLPAGSPSPSALPEFFGNVILVNGQAWPKLDVEPRLYRLRLLNGSDSRFYNLWINSGGADMRTPDGNGPMIQVIGNDDGLLPAPVAVSQLVIGPGERYDVLVDFKGWENQTLVMRNNARAPFPMGTTPNPRTEGQLMAFVVGTTVSDTRNNTLPTSLASVPALSATKPPRQLILFEGSDSYGRIMPMLGTLATGTALWNQPTTEKPQLNATEVWEVYNATVDAHPIHLHLVKFQILGRQKYAATVTPKEMIDHNGATVLGGTLSAVKLRGKAKPAGSYEAGWKDTAVMYPGEVTRVIAKFDRSGEYVWHCHILSHEDHEMMRRFEVV
jgi:spore coat protein A